MSRFAKISAEQELERYRERYGGAAFYLLRPRIAVHERWSDIASTSPPRIMPCPCCRSMHAVVTEYIDEDPVLVHPKTRWRMARSAVRTSEGLAEWDHIASQAQEYGTEGASVCTIDVTYRVARSDLPIFYARDPTVVYLSGGWRGRKTQLALNMFAREIILEGGTGVLFWFLAPILKQSFRLMQKMFRGNKGTPPVLPPEMIESCPKAITAKNQDTILIDGTVLENQHSARRGSGLEGAGVKGILLDEAQKVSQPDVYQIARSRLMGDQGRMFISSVPPDAGDNCEWLESEVVRQAKLEDMREAQGETFRRYFTMHELSSFDNPWVDREGIQAAYDATQDPITRARKFLGQWSSFGILAYEDVWNPAKYELDHIAHDAQAWGFARDVTQETTQRHFGVRDKYLGAADFNENPQTQLIARVFADGEGKQHIVILDEQVIHGSDPIHAARMLGRRKDGRYKQGGLSLVCDANGFHEGHRYGGQEHKTSDSYRFKQEGFHVKAPIDRPATKASSGKSNPSVGESRTLVRELMRNGQILVNRGSCPLLCDAIAKAPNRAKRKSDSNTALDKQVYNLEDCLRYLVWKVFSKDMLKKHEPDAAHEGFQTTW